MEITKIILRFWSYGSLKDMLNSRFRGNTFEGVFQPVFGDERKVICSLTELSR